MSNCDLTSKKCQPCEGGTPLAAHDEQRMHLEIPVWKLDREGIHKLSRSFKFKDFVEAMAFVNNVAVLAEAEGHHPDLHVSYNKVLVELYTHAVGGLSENDFIVAAKIDKL